MEKTVELFRWDFPGSATGVLLTLLLIAVAVAYSYRHPLRALPPAARRALTALRIAWVAALLFCLADPRIETVRSISTGKNPRIAVLFDESGSMTIPDLWGRTRLDAMRKFWNEKVKQEKTQCDFFHFGKKLRESSASDRACPPSNGTETRLFDALRELRKKQANPPFDGVVVLTDGIDTTTEERAAATAEIAAAGVPHIFVPATGELPAPPQLEFRRLEAPTRIRCDSELDLVFHIRRGNLPSRLAPELLLFRNGKVAERRKLPAGSGLGTVKIRYAAGSVGRDLLSARLTAGGKEQHRIDWSIDKTERKGGASVLVYNGALDFGVRFLKNVFLDDPAISVEIRYAKGVFPGLGRGSDFPSAKELEKFDALVLMNVKRSELRQGAEEEILRFVRSGGGVIFITGNPATARELAGSTLEKLLPVRFSATGKADPRAADDAARILRSISPGGGTRHDGALLRSREFTFRPEPLAAFELTSEGERSPIFRKQLPDGKTLPFLPRFQSAAEAESLKPGAVMLAFRSAGERKIPLLAYQNFGAGRSMVLASDPLWRWRMATPSSDNSFETFWKNLFSYLALGKNREFRWESSNLAGNGTVLEVRLIPGAISPEPGRLRAETESGGERRPLPLSERNRSFSAAVPVPETPHPVTVTAFLDGKPAASFLWSRSEVNRPPPELRVLEPDSALLTELADLPGSSLHDPEKTLDLHALFGGGTVVEEERSSRPLWHGTFVFWLLALLTTGEWIVRRHFKLW